MSQLAAPTPTPQHRFFALLKHDILKLDLAELDFGIYRILNYRRAQVLAFLDKTLPEKIAAWVTALEKEGGRALADTEQASIYYHLHTFFSRYWDDGDFIPRARRGGSAAYAVPYNGQDTHFHWATKGSHYVKSGELFSRYAYQDSGTEVAFILERADTEKDNAKGAQKYFFPASVTTEPSANAVRVSWQWRAPTEPESKRYKGKTAQTADNDDGSDDDGDNGEALGESAAGNSLQERVLDAWARGLDYKTATIPAALDREKLASNARRYVRKNSSDFFVHPQLGSFLTGELDVYLKHEFVQVWDAADSELPRIRAKFKLVRDIATDLITFLDQIERFQATLFEKRKFVLQADYLVQCSGLLREAGAAGQALVSEAAANADQAAEWAHWVGETAAHASGSGSPKKKTSRSAPHEGAALLQRFPHLPLNTKHFSADFKARVLACFNDIEAALGGELFHADNYAALRTMEPAYRERVKCIYIDPPYNTGSDGFLYKDEFTRHSAWASMMSYRLTLSAKHLRSNGAGFVSFNDFERTNLLGICQEALPREFAELGLWVWKSRAKPTNTGPAALQPQKGAEYVFGFGSNQSTFYALNSGEERTYPLSLAGRKYRITTILTSNRGRYRRETMRTRLPNGYTPPIDQRWKVGEEELLSLYETNRIEFRDTTPMLRVFEDSDDEQRIAFWTFIDPEISGTAETGKAELDSLLNKGHGFDTVKPTALLTYFLGATTQERDYVFDYFAGTATTGHAVLNLNREDGGARKFLLVEQGEYFDTVTLPRIAKVMTAPEWKDGAPKDTVVHDDAGDSEHWSRRTLPLVRVLRLERYEDSLNALVLSQAARSAHAAQPDLSLVADDGQESLLRYWLADDAAGSAVTLNTQALNAPFSYQLTLHEPTGERRAQVDVLETARLLLGLVPKRQREVADANGARHQLLEAMLAADVVKAKANAKPVLLWLRATDDERDEAAAQAERLWLIDTLQAQFGRSLNDYGQIMHNRHALWLTGENGLSIDTLLAERMMERAQ